MEMTPLNLELRRSEIADLKSFFQFQLDEEANYLAAFTSKDPSDQSAYFEKYEKLLSDPAINMQTILVDDVVVGSISKFEIEGDAEITYWIDKALWGKAVGTTALRLFLTTEHTRPLFGRVAFDNYGSQKVLQKCGFVKVGTDSGFANARQKETEEFIYQLI